MVGVSIVNGETAVLYMEMKVDSCIPTVRTNRMHYLLSVYFNNYLVHVSSRLTVQHQEVLLCTYSILHMSCIYVERLLARSGWFLLYGYVTVQINKTLNLLM